jgi:hypothetical protein
MGSHDPFEYLKHKLWPKKGLGIKLPPKVKNRPDLILHGLQGSYYWKFFDKG